MPKVSERYRDARREQIMDAARRCFLRNGFRETSMQDLFAESGLSSGAFYRYFSGKDELIIAIAQDNFRDVLTTIRTAAENAEGSLGDALANAIDLVDAKHAENGQGGIAVQVWAEALRNPRLAAEFTAMLKDVHREIGAIVRRNQAAGTLPAQVSADAIASVLLGAVPGYIVQIALLGADAPAGVSDAVRALWPNRAGDSLDR
ncbi:MAG TPA: TetR/AcrR family transcriptional regulator [Actinospica sp.]|nr:TetR/AcrR family transcriptional regulator [Actinospica sp.]